MSTAAPTDDPAAGDLQRFLDAQDGVYPAALAELRAGSKRTHWMWFIFPQLRGLGRSPMAHTYGLADTAEAVAFAAHPVLGSRLLTCVRALLELPGDDPVAVLGDVDAQKLRSAMTLFAGAAADPAPFQQVLDRYFAGSADPVTLARIGR